MFTSWSLSFHSRRITEDEIIIIEKLINNFYEKCENDNLFLIKNDFYEKKLNIRIESNIIIKNYEDNDYLGLIREEKDMALYSNFKNKAGKCIKWNIIKYEFDTQPYDYPIGNIFYVVAKCEYKNAKTTDFFFITDEFKIYEIRKVVAQL